MTACIVFAHLVRQRQPETYLNVLQCSTNQKCGTMFGCFGRLRPALELGLRPGLVVCRLIHSCIYRCKIVRVIQLALLAQPHTRCPTHGQTYLGQVHLSGALHQGGINLCWVLNARERAGGFGQPVHCAKGHQQCFIPLFCQEIKKQLNPLVLLAAAEPHCPYGQQVTRVQLDCCC